MKKNLRLITGGLGAIIALALSSCAYDPYYGGSSGSYSSYGDGYGYGGSSFSTSLFVSTGDSRWGYDPHCRSYYDYNRRAYYDPYLYGYYPVGYRPPVIIGVPHPHGWSSGGRYCPPPRHVKNVYLTNYRNRESAYRSSNHSWAREVRQQPSSDPRNRYDRDDNRGGRDRDESNSRDPRNGGFFGSGDSRDPRSGRSDPSNLNRGNRESDNDRSSQGERQPRVPSTYNTPVEIRPSERDRSSRQPDFSRSDDRRRSGESSGFERPSARPSGFERQPAPSPRSEQRSFERPERSERSGGESRDRDRSENRGGNRDEGRVKGLGEG